MENENIYDKIKEIFGGLKGSFNILEEQIDLDVQMEYFEYSKEIKENDDISNVIDTKNNIFNNQIPLDTKRKILAQLASIEDVEAYRTIEQYLEEPDPEIRDWALLAFQESKMLLESKLLDENKVFISTGLGGKGTKLRYFIVLISSKSEKFTDLQKRVIKTELETTLKKNNAEIENINFCGNFSTIETIIPLNIPIKETFRAAIGECNQYGAFLKPNFIITNVKKLSEDEIKDFLKKEEEKCNEE